METTALGDPRMGGRPAAYVLEPVEALDATAAGQVRRIYEDGFPARLRSDFSALTAHREDGELALALLYGGRPRGFAMLRPLGATGWVFLRYFVVDQHLRGQGVGGILWQHLTGRLRADGYTMLVFDVEDPEEPGRDEAESVIRSRRIAFYQRLGAGLLPVRGYHTPNPDTDTGAESWVPMLLLAAPLAAPLAEAGPASGAEEARAAEQARAVVSAVHRYRWDLDPGHPQASAVRIATVPGHD
jgi:GNAT superfamily N-acetyltransferase